MSSLSRAAITLALGLLSLTTACGDKDDDGSDGSGAADCELEIVNGTGYDLYYVYVSDSADGDWGDDILGDEVMLDGDAVYLDVPSNPDSWYDIKAIDSDGDEYYVYEFDYCEDGEDLSYTLTMDDYAG